MLKSLVLYSLTILFNIITATPPHELNSQPQLCSSNSSAINIDSFSISSNMSDTTAANQAYFNQIADEYDSRFASTITALEAEIKEHLAVLNIKPNGRLLDYACGTGVLSRVLGDNLSQCIGIDVSEKMVGAYNAKMANVANRTAYLGDLLSDPPSESVSGAEFHGFDAAGVGAGFHHFDDCVLAAKRLVERLNPGGVLFVLDFVPHEKSPDHATSHGVRHHGFSEETIRDVFVKAGAEGDFVYLPMKTEMIFENKYGEGKHMHRQYFMARATKL